ncbi:ROK family protein [Aquimarina sp. AU474]|uniref:ROK family protein n=1 Tax=Aquimarina sp. AU474 TaxID=2108529 RepID=UPI000D69CE41|nr:ROK family protein [Aquimarina sp. AU474]
MVLGVDIGGSHISVAIVDQSGSYQIQHIYTMEVDHKESPEVIIGRWICTLELTLSYLDVEKLNGIGIAIPGPFDYKNGVFPDDGENKFEMVYNFNLRDCIVEKLKLEPSVPVRFYNDAACFGIGEAWVGKMSSYKKAVAITLGTGFGATFLHEGIPVTSGKGVPLYGELYHLPFGDDIADTHFSTQWFVRRYRELTNNEINGVKELVKLKDNKEIKIQIFEEFANNLALFLEPWLKNFEADAMVIGGNISNAWPFFGDPLIKTLKNLEIEIPILKSEDQEHITMTGAARLADDNFYNKL